MISTNEQKLFEILDSLSIKYRRYEHKAIYTVDEANELEISIPGVHCKNLFIKNRKGDTHYLVILEDCKKANLKSLEKQIKSTKLSFASEERLFNYLGLKPGAVTPFGLINDINSEVVVLIDKDLVDASILNFHPNVNTATIGLSFSDLEKFIEWHKNNFHYVDMN